MTEIPLDVQALAVECAAVNQRAGVERRTELAERGKWNKDLLPGDDRLATELAAAAVTMRTIANLRKERASSATNSEGGPP